MRARRRSSGPGCVGHRHIVGVHDLHRYLAQVHDGVFVQVGGSIWRPGHRDDESRRWRGDRVGEPEGDCGSDDGAAGLGSEPAAQQHLGGSRQGVGQVVEHAAPHELCGDTRVLGEGVGAAQLYQPGGAPDDVLERHRWTRRDTCIEGEAQLLGDVLVYRDHAAHAEASAREGRAAGAGGEGGLQDKGQAHGRVVWVECAPLALYREVA